MLLFLDPKYTKLVNRIQSDYRAEYTIRKLVGPPVFGSCNCSNGSGAGVPGHYADAPSRSPCLTHRFACIHRRD